MFLLILWRFESFILFWELSDSFCSMTNWIVHLILKKWNDSFDSLKNWMIYLILWKLNDSVDSMKMNDSVDNEWFIWFYRELNDSWFCQDPDDSFHSSWKSSELFNSIKKIDSFDFLKMKLFKSSQNQINDLFDAIRN